MSTEQKAVSGSEERAARRRDDRRQQILAAAKEIFAELGYHNASISELISRAGIARGTFYLYFENKRKVFDSILGQALEDLAARIQLVRLDEGAPSPRVQVAANLSRVLGYLFDDRPLSQLLLNPGLTPDTESAQRLDAFYERVTQVLQSSLEHGIRMGLVRRCDTAIVAAGLLGAIRGVTRRLLHGDERPDVDRVVNELLAFGWRGVVDEAWDVA